MFLNCWFSPIFRQRITAVMMSTSFYDRCLHFLFSPPTIYQSPSTHWKRKLPLSSCRALWITSKALGLTALFGPLRHGVSLGSVRTNNDVEGWHNRVNTHAQKSNLQFYLLIELIYKEASKIPLQLKLISEGKLRRRQRKQTKMVQWKILQLWDDYANIKITASHLLKKCGSLYTLGV